MHDRTVTLPTTDHGPVTLPEPSWCVGHESVPGGLRVDILHQGPEAELSFRGCVIATASLVQSPFAERLSRGAGVSISLLGETYAPAGVDEFAAALVAHAADLRHLARHLSVILGGGQ